MIHQVHLPKISNQDNDLYSLGRFLIENDKMVCTYYGLLEEKETTEEEYSILQHLKLA